MTTTAPHPSAEGAHRTTRRWVLLGVGSVALVVFALWAKARIDGLDQTTQATNPIIRWEYIFKRERTPDELWSRTREHLELTVVPVLIGLVVSSVLSALALRWRWTAGPVTAAAGFLYTIPALALFGVLVSYTSNWTAAVIALTSYTLLIMVRNIVAGIHGVPRAALDAADGIGMSRWQRFGRVELPLALPVILTGVRVATVTVVGLVAVSVVIQLGGLASLIFDGYRRDYTTLMVLGSGLSILLAVVLDVVIRAVEWVLTPWSHRAGSR